MPVVRPRITAIGTVLLMVLLPLALCCMATPQHACCKDRCAMAPDAVPLLAVAPARPRIDVLIVLATPLPRTNVPNSVVLMESSTAALQSRSGPAATIQLRI